MSYPGILPTMKYKMFSYLRNGEKQYSQKQNRWQIGNYPVNREGHNMFYILRKNLTVTGSERSTSIYALEKSIVV